MKTETHKRAYSFAAGLGLILILLLIAVAAAPETTSLAQEPPPPSILDRSLDEIPFLAGQSPAPEPSEATAPFDMAYWSRIVFQSLHDGNWEIYIGKSGDHTSPRRLTTDPASDIHPHLNLGCSRVVFASSRTGNYEIFAINPDATGLTQLTFNGSDDVNPTWSPDGTQIAFESYRDGQAEIYVMNADGSNPVRLTESSSYEGEPAWSPDGSRIAYISHMQGGYHLYVMNADGSNKTRIVDQRNCENPVWSPDGSRLAYDSDQDQDDWQELWIVNADGSNGQEIYDMGVSKNDTWAGGWSPDGRYLAYTHIQYFYYQGVWYWTEAHVILLNLETFARWWPVGWGTEWNPDWQSMDPWGPVSTMVSLPGTSPAPFAVTWSGSDAGVSGLLGYDVQVKEGAGGDWTDWQTETTATSAVYPGLGGHSYYFRCRAKDNAGNIEPWPQEYDTGTTVEAIPPRTAVNLLPTYSRNNSVIRWGGSDPGGSGIQAYDVQYRDLAGGNWTDWQMATAYTSAIFSGTVGHTYAFRCRATDRAQNAEAWPGADGDTSATLYTWGVSGRVCDNAGTPVVAASITTVPGAFHSVASSMDGAYAAYVLDNTASYAATWDKATYGNLPATQFSALQDAQVEAILPPADNAVLNWGFENSSLESGDWLPGGIVTPVVTDTIQHTGRYAALLGRRPSSFAPPSRISNSTGSSSGVQLVADEAGVLHLVWIRDYDRDIYYARREKDGTWSNPEDISNTDRAVTAPYLAVDKAGAVHVVWQGDNPSLTPAIFYARRGSDGTWSDPQNLSGSLTYSWDPHLIVDGEGLVHVVWRDPTPGSYHIYYAWRGANGAWSSPQDLTSRSNGTLDQEIAVEENGVVHLVWVDMISGNGDIYYIRRDNWGAWSNPQQVSTGYAWSMSPQMAVDENGVVHLVWIDDSEGIGIVYYAHRARNGSWSVAQPLSNAVDDSLRQQLAIETDGTAHVIWQTRTFSDEGDIFYTRKASDGTWSSPQNVSPGASEAGYPHLAVDGSGIVHVVWADYDSTSVVYYSRRKSDGTWSSPKNLSISLLGSYRPQVGTDADGQVHVVWQEQTVDGLNLYYAGPAVAGQTGDSSIAQAVVMPAASSAPVLSFLYQLDSAFATNNTWFSVQADNGIETTTIFSTTTNTAGWTHHWSDLTLWAGQTITLTFTVHETADRPYAWAYLDEVTVGSAYPDVWVSKQSRTPAALPGQQTAFTLTYGNRGGAPASGVRLTDTLPTELSFVAASPPPLTNTPALVWDVGDLPAKSDSFTIVVTATVSPATPMMSYVTNTASIGAASTELETANNSVQASAFVGRRIYLPLISRDF